MRVLFFILALTAIALLSCGQPYQDHVYIEGDPQKERPFAGQVIGQAAHFAIPPATNDILAGWSIYIRHGQPSRTLCAMKIIEIDADADRWRDHLSHETTHAILCELRPDDTEADHHFFMRQNGLCYGSPFCTP